VLINIEAFRGAVRKGNWKLVKIALFPGKTELFDLATYIPHPDLAKLSHVIV
jgi:hypothetical protein